RVPVGDEILWRTPEDAPRELLPGGVVGWQVERDRAAPVGPDPPPTEIQLAQIVDAHVTHGALLPDDYGDRRRGFFRHRPLLPAPHGGREKRGTPETSHRRSEVDGDRREEPALERTALVGAALVVGELVVGLEDHVRRRPPGEAEQVPVVGAPQP